jgi:hypothetical protein
MLSCLSQSSTVVAPSKLPLRHMCAPAWLASFAFSGREATLLLRWLPPDFLLAMRFGKARFLCSSPAVKPSHVAAVVSFL